METKNFLSCNAVYAVLFTYVGIEILDTILNNFRVQIFEVHLCSAEIIANKTLRNYYQLVKLRMKDISLNKLLLTIEKNLRISVSELWKERKQRYNDIFWRGKVRVLTNLRDMVRPSA